MSMRYPEVEHDIVEFVKLHPGIERAHLYKHFFDSGIPYSIYYKAFWWSKVTRRIIEKESWVPSAPTLQKDGTNPADYRPEPERKFNIYPRE